VPLNTQALSVLKAGRELIATPERWAKLTYARDSQGVTCPVNDHDVRRLCALGAIVAAGLTLGASFEAIDAAGEALRQCLPWGYTKVPTFNDAFEVDHDMVLSLFKRAAASLVTEAQAA
jgi:hypothetical protein